MILRSRAGEAEWATLYRIAAAAVLVQMVLIPVQMVVFGLWPPPVGAPVTNWFTLFQRSRLLGLLSLDLLLLVDQVLLLPLFVGLSMGLRTESPSLALLAVVFGLVGTAVCFASGAAFEMLSLSRHYAAADEAQRAAYRAAGEALLAVYQGTACDVSYLLQSIAGLTFSALMLRSRAFGRTAAWLGPAGFVLGLFIPGWTGIGIALLSVVVLWVWYLLLVRGFLRLARGWG